MKILIVLNHTRLTGVNTFNYTFINEIKKRHYENVSIYIPPSNFTHTPFIEELQKIVDTIYLVKPNYNKFDKVYFNYLSNIPMEKIEAQTNFFVHGLMNPDYLIEKGMHIDNVFCFGERALEYINHPTKTLIRNFIDLERFKLSLEERKHHKCAIFNSRDAEMGYEVVERVCKYTGYELKVIGKFRGKDQIWNVENELKDVDFVIATGRCAFEAMAMGKPVILAGANPGEGYINTYSNFKKNLETNFSGWMDRKLPPLYMCDSLDLLKEFNIYREYDSKKVRSWIERDLDPEIHVNKILNA